MGNDRRMSWNVDDVFWCSDGAGFDGATSEIGEETIVEGVCGDEDPSDDSGLEGSNSGTGADERWWWRIECVCEC